MKDLSRRDTMRLATLGGLAVFAEAIARADDARPTAAPISFREEHTGAGLTVMYAVVNQDGQCERGRGVTGTNHPAPGCYVVSFEMDVTSGVFVATIGCATTDTAPPAQISVATRKGSTKSVYVETTNAVPQYTPLHHPNAPYHPQLQHGYHWGHHGIDALAKRQDRPFHLLVIL